MSFNKIYDIAASGMAAQRLRVQLISANVANSETTRTPEGGPFQKKDAVFQVKSMGTTADGLPLAGVRIADIHISEDPFVFKYEPGHPDADADGVVTYPNVNPIEEMVNLTEATRSFEANVAVVLAVRSMGQSALDMLRTQ
ncbi:MAG: flagellar basal body rod protein FlgC [Holophagales bacterium]|jgi:flagellar basal-body rod protein FlgC|nr:flagellar basal body rod protein FlgC [Holophagales bacterium]